MIEVDSIDDITNKLKFASSKEKYCKMVLQSRDLDPLELYTETECRCRFNTATKRLWSILTKSLD